MKQQRISHVFVEEIPPETEQGVLYVSMECATAIHRCACGCGREVVTPLSPTDWSLIFDGDTVSLDPSVGNWSLPCRAHYFIDRGTVTWAGDMSNAAIEFGRSRDRRNKAAYFSAAKPIPSALMPAAPVVPPPAPRDSAESELGHAAAPKAAGLWQSLKTWWKS